ncbi:MAG: prolyl oligopeptidase family serine peptidase [Planctomycetes bacterium]|jgi:acetyl esterase/lipase|nr:prolyl oligopeptidase family serine peptidase [Planctomycetota bacterium]
MADTQPIWPDPVLSAVTLTVLADASAEGAAGVLVLPGGGYGMLADHEAEPVAEKFAEAGLGAAVLRYRLGSQGHRHPGMIHDALRAIRVLRQRGWRRVGVLGFSAGGHLASTAAVHFDRFRCADDDLLDQYHARPDAVLLGYAVIDLQGPHAHRGCTDHLLGPEADDAQRELLSTHRHVTTNTPPTFLWHTAQDAGVPAEHTLDFARACRAHAVPVELHVYERGGHGVGLADGTRGQRLPEVTTWIDLAIAFARRHLHETEGA